MANEPKLTLDMLTDEPFLFREQGSGTRHAIEQFLKRHNNQMNVKMTIESNEAIKHSVMSKLGISILSAHTLSYGGQAGLITLPVQELPIDSHWFFVWSKSKRQTIIAAEFLNYVECEGRQILQTELANN